MIAALRVRTTADEAKGLDNASVPGDRLGAAGFDSAFSAHAKASGIYRWDILENSFGYFIFLLV